MIARCIVIALHWGRTGQGRRFIRRLNQRNRRMAQRVNYVWGLWPKRRTWRIGR